jgi:SAM-dependent methyltransferase
MERAEQASGSPPRGPESDVHDRIRHYWDRDSPTYDATKSHAISDPLEAAAWRQALVDVLPQPGARVLDIGAGTGALGLLAAELGCEVTELDLSPGMLAQAERKAEDRGLQDRVTFVVGSASEPPDGPFDVVMERHVLWTLPDPAGALARWRRVASRLVLFEGVWGQTDPARRAKDLLAHGLRRVLRTPPDHHAPYPEEVLAELPLARASSPAPLIEAVVTAGWTGVRVKRLRDVEWAARLHEGWPLGWLEHRPRYVLSASA